MPYVGRGDLEPAALPAELSLQSFFYIHEHMKHIYNCLTTSMYLLVAFGVSGSSFELTIIRSHMTLLLLRYNNFLYYSFYTIWF